MDHPHGLDALDALRERTLAGLCQLARGLTQIPWARAALANTANVRCLGLYGLTEGAGRVYPAVVLHVRRPEDERYPERIATIAVYPRPRGRGWAVYENASGYVHQDQYIGGTDAEPETFIGEDPWPTPAELTATLDPPDAQP